MGGTNLRTSYYWTSTQAYASNAWRIRLYNGVFSSVPKNDTGLLSPDY